VTAIEILSEICIIGSCITGDKAYGTKAIRGYITEQGAIYIIPPKSNTKEPWDFESERYKERNIVERFINKIKHYRRVATRYDKLLNRYSSFVYLACAMILLK